MRIGLSCLGILTLAGVLPSVADEGMDRPKRSSFEAGAMIGYHSNVYGMTNENGEPTTDATISTIYLNGETGTPHMRIYFGALGTWYTGKIDISDERTGRLGVMVRGDKARVAAEYVRSPTRVYEEDADTDFFELESVQLKARLGESRKVWIEGRYSVEEWMFSPGQSGRSAQVRDAAATVRFPIARELGIRASYLWERKAADDFQYSRDGTGRSFALEANPSTRISLLARYLVRTRVYEDAPQTSENFNREDKVEEVTLNLRVQVGKTWGIRVEDSYRRSLSTLSDRSYDAILAKAGIFVTF